ncbi:MAG: hypothetical protein KAR47_05315 [Planctomycetes bacterium]|nr:hypothetical protein [Planctomycetota bacterium]
MKRVLFIAMALAIATPAMAMVTFSATDAGEGKLQISYVTDGDEPRGIALAIDAGDAYVESGEAHFSGDAAFNTFMDYAYGNAAEYNVGDGHGIADPVQAGEPAYPASQFSLSLGVLDQGGGQLAGPTVATDLATIQLSAAVLPATVNVTITADTLRGPSSGVVGSTLDSNLDGAAIIAVVVIPEPVPDTCMLPSHPDYATWVSLGMPDCWCYERQCNGDADGYSQFGGVVAVFSDDLDIFLPVYGAPGVGAGNIGVCADFDHGAQFGGVVRVFSDDLALFLPNYGSPSTPNCPMDAVGNDQSGPDGIIDFSAWIVPPPK